MSAVADFTHQWADDMILEHYRAPHSWLPQPLLHTGHTVNWLLQGTHNTKPGDEEEGVHYDQQL